MLVVVLLLMLRLLLLLMMLVVVMMVMLMMLRLLLLVGHGCNHLTGGNQVGRNVCLKNLLDWIEAVGSGSSCCGRVFRHRRRRLLVALAPILEPVAHLGQREAGLLGEGALLVGRRVSIAQIAVLEGVARLLLETIHSHFAVPDASRQRMLLSDPILINCTQLSSTESFRFAIVGLVPESLQLEMILLLELVALEDLVERLEVAPCIGHMSLGSSHDLAAGLALLGRQQGQKSAQLFDVPPRVASPRGCCAVAVAVAIGAVAADGRGGSIAAGRLIDIIVAVTFNHQRSAWIGVLQQVLWSLMVEIVLLLLL